MKEFTSFSRNKGDGAGEKAAWLTLGQARRLLGVNETSLRHWADSGRIRAFRTPGGHRRFAQEDLEALTRGSLPRGEVKSRKNLGELALRRIRRQLRGHPLPTWHQALDAQGLLKMRLLGHRLLSLAADSQGRKRDRSLLEEARYLGLEHGRETARAGLSLSSLVDAFLFFRNSLLDEVKHQVKDKGQNPEEALESWRKAYLVADEALRAAIEAFEQASEARC